MIRKSKKSHRKGGNSSERVMEGHGSGCLRDSIVRPFISKLGSEGGNGMCQKDKEGQVNLGFRHGMNKGVTEFSGGD